MSQGAKFGVLAGLDFSPGPRDEKFKPADTPESPKWLNLKSTPEQSGPF
jgi:hypothetical protein